MKRVAQLIITGLVIALVLTVTDIPLPVLYGEVWVGVALSAVLYWVVGLLIGWAILTSVGLSGAAIGGALGRSKESAGMGGCIGVIAGIPIMMAADVLLLMHLHEYVSWFPAFTFWPALVIAIVTTIASISNESSSNKKD